MDEWNLINVLALQAEPIKVFHDGKEGFIMTFLTSSGDRVFVAPVGEHNELRIFQIADRVTDKSKMN